MYPINRPEDRGIIESTVETLSDSDKGEGDHSGKIAWKIACEFVDHEASQDSTNLDRHFTSSHDLS